MIPSLIRGREASNCDVGRYTDDSNSASFYILAAVLYTAGRWSVRPKYVARVDVCCG